MRRVENLYKCRVVTKSRERGLRKRRDEPVIKPTLNQLRLQSTGNREEAEREQIWLT
jgi:hypothetical protein